jgi:hypothetical protein
MTGTTTVPAEVDVYMHAVRTALADLPADERDDLLVEVEASIADAAAETDAPVAARLGPPEDFAAELRAAAGFHPPVAAVRAENDGLLALWRRLRGHSLVQRTRMLAHDLAPIWWVARGYAAVGIVAVWVATRWSGRYPLIPRFDDNPALGVALVGLGVLASIALGLAQRRRRAPVGLTILANLALAIALVAVLVQVDNSTMSRPAATFVVGEPVPGLAYDGNPVTNVYPYDRAGRLLHDVFLYDQAGAPLNVAGDPGIDPNRRFLRARNGKTLLNGFPIRYFRPGTHKVANPNAGPPVHVPSVATRPLPAEGTTRRRSER